ncbi:MAG: asparagine synthase-related protein [Burkholderiaceae bacterium]|nr:asparagine synthase-related protein [Burkholderiaceae bacterium]
MFDQDSSLALGSPRFSDSRLARLAVAKGTPAAWREALIAHGAQAANSVTGDFAVGLHEPGGRSFAAVDRFAIQTLCYRVVNGQLRFATRADVLADADTPIDPQAIFDYLYFHIIPSPRTIYKGIYRLPPGHYALFENGQLTVAPYWVPTFEEQQNASFDALKDEFRQLLRDAVATQLDGSKPACFLSGGTDSSTVAGMLALSSGKTAATYSIGFDTQGYDEMEFARIAANHFKTEHHEYYVTPDDLVRSIPAVAAHYDQPFGNSSALPTYYCAKMAREDGVSKLLAGDGGDELFGGNTRYAKQRVFGWYDSIPAALRGNLLEPVAALQTMRRIPLISKAASYVNQASVPMPDRMMTYNLLTRFGVESVLTDKLLADVDQQYPVRHQRNAWDLVQSGSLVNRMLAFDWRYTLADCDLPKVMGTTEMAGVAVGFPLLDDRLLAFSQKLPTTYKLRGLKLRWFFKEALRGFLPDEILVKKKQGFGLPFGVWANTHPALKALATDSLHSLAARGVVRADFVQPLICQRLQEHPGYYGEMVWILMMLEQWLAAKAPRFSLVAK